MDNMNDDTKYMINDEKNDIQFVHFTTSSECDDFIKYITEKQFNISHKCCYGIGCGIKKIKRNELDTIVKEYQQIDTHN